MTAIPILMFWALALWGSAGRSHARLVYLYFAVLPFGSFAVVPPSATGGLTVAPAPVVALLIIVRCLMLRRGLDGLLTAALSRRRALLLTVFWVVAVVVTVFIPSILAGRVTIIPFRDTVLVPALLHPSVQNLSQLGYLTVSVFAVFSLAHLLRDPGLRQPCLRAVCLGGVVAVATGALDFASTYLPTAPLLGLFRTASYALLVSHEVLGAKRVVGLMPEASSYGMLCLSLLTLLHFLRRAIDDDRLRRRQAPVLQGLLALGVALSTSSAAYAGLMVFGLVAMMEWSWRAAVLRRGAAARRGLSGEFWLACGAVSALMLILIFLPHLLDRAVAMFDKMVLEKASSASFDERSFWTAVSWHALVASGGVGVGVGSTRASSSVVGVLSSTGVLGAVCYYGFVLQTAMRRARPGDEEGAMLLGALRWSFLPPFADSLLIGIGVDFGPILTFLYGFACAVAWSAAERPAVPSPRRPIVRPNLPA